MTLVLCPFCQIVEKKKKNSGSRAGKPDYGHSDLFLGLVAPFRHPDVYIWNQLEFYQISFDSNDIGRRLRNPKSAKS